jgi:membrane associated rhomboid family serine protease
VVPIRDHLPTRIFPFVNYGLIALNIGCFLVEVSGDSAGATSEAFVDRWSLIPAHLIAHPQEYAPTLFTHLFLHAGLGHIAGNMLYLWIFGDNVEDALGHLRYLLFYFVCGVAAALAQVAAAPSSTLPMLGASGAISGVLAAYVMLYPSSPITVLNPIPVLWLFWGLFIYLPAWFVIGEFFVVNLWSALQPTSAPGGVAFVAHVGGFVTGLLLVRPLQQRDRLEYDRNYRVVRRRGISADDDG